MMRFVYKYKWILIVLIVIGVFCFIYPRLKTFSEIKADYESQGTYMSVKEAEKRWGRKTFSIDAFKEGNIQDRASMVVDLIDRKIFVGKKVEEIKKALGNHTGYYWNDHIPAYIIERGYIPKGKWKTVGDTWQIVFFQDMKGRVKEIKIHKNCCD